MKWKPANHDSVDLISFYVIIFHLTSNCVFSEVSECSRLFKTDKVVHFYLFPYMVQLIY